VWRGECATGPGAIAEVVRAWAGDAARLGRGTEPPAPWLVHDLWGLGSEVVCLDARRARAALALRPNRTGGRE
jgi:transposase